MLARPTLALAVALLLQSADVGTAVAINENTTLILHGAQASEWFLPCNHPALQGVDCVAMLPQTDVSGFTRPAIFLLIRSYESVIGIQCAFDVPASWTLLYSDWLCLGGLYPDVNPQPPWGPFAGSLSYGIDPISGGALVTVGRMYFSSASAGCMTIIDSGYPGGTSVLSPNYTWTRSKPRTAATFAAVLADTTPATRFLHLLSQPGERSNRVTKCTAK